MPNKKYSTWEINIIWRKKNEERKMNKQSKNKNTEIKTNQKKLVKVLQDYLCIFAWQLAQWSAC
jgi:hypothetical protein